MRETGSPLAGPVVYAVAEPSSPSPHSRLPVFEDAKKLAEGATHVLYWPADRPASQARVALYACPPLPSPSTR